MSQFLKRHFNNDAFLDYSKPRKRWRLLIDETVKKIAKNKNSPAIILGKMESKLRI